MSDLLQKTPAMEDVAKPGTVPADPTSRPIVTGRSMVAVDPMLGSSEKTPVSSAPHQVPSMSKSKIMPLSSSADIKKEVEAETKQPSAAETNSETETENKEEKLVDLQEIIESGDYNVSIKNSSSAGLFKKIGLLITLLVVAVIAGYLLVDARIIKTSIRLPFHIFSQQDTPKNTEEEIVSNAIFTLKNSGLKFSYSPKFWRQAEGNSSVGINDESSNKNGEQIVSSHLLYVPDKSTESYIVFTEQEQQPANTSFLLCGQQKNCSADISDFSAKKLPQVKKSTMYLVTYIEKATSSSGTKYAVKASLQNSDKLTELVSYGTLVSSKDNRKYMVSAEVNILSDAPLTPSRTFVTLEEAQAFLKSDKLAKSTSVLMSASD